MKRVRLHLVAFVMLMPCILLVNDGEAVYNFIGLAWIFVLCCISCTSKGKRFIRSFYREILRLEKMWS